ncbi:MAG TPA: Gfo/Idh/MocA family oxidoreductase [bacterium]|nr:Gfo/Idh/MocA family oxidoreductase [bacterium]HPN42122.1 Gfo/Idh/MocA family oxidoreductase [bacterium]
MKNFALIGAAGYIAPRHLKAIKETGNRLVCAVDKSDSVGILDKYFDDVDFFTEFERFDRHIEMLRRLDSNKKIDYVSICSPNYLHDAHIRFALRADADAICEKPLMLNPWNCDALEEVENHFGHKVYNILQLRVHPVILQLKNKIDRQKEKRYSIDLSYITSRGNWYHYSWKGDESKSGGVATNIGIHFFDMLIWIFGKVVKSDVHYTDENKAGGFIELEKADVRWFLSIDKHDLPAEVRNAGKTTFRSITMDKEEIEFSDGFTDLHTVVYKDILDGKGYGVSAARPSIELAYNIRHAQIVQLHNNEIHPFLKGIIKNN